MFNEKEDKIMMEKMLKALKKFSDYMENFLYKYPIIKEFELEKEKEKEIDSECFAVGNVPF